MRDVEVIYKYNILPTIHRTYYEINISNETRRADLSRPKQQRGGFFPPINNARQGKLIELVRPRNSTGHLRSLARPRRPEREKNGSPIQHSDFCYLFKHVMKFFLSPSAH